MPGRLFFRAAVAAGLGLAATAEPAADLPTLQTLVGAPDSLKLSGSFRVRYEGLGGQFRPGLDSADNLVTLRTTLFAEYDSGPIRIGAELFDSRAFGGSEGSAVDTSEVNALDLGQAYIAAVFHGALGSGSTTSIEAGRFSLDLGSRRLVARNNFRNTINAFTGARFDWTSASKDRLTLFFVLPNIRQPDDEQAVLSNKFERDLVTFDLTLWGGLLALPVGDGGTNAELYFFTLDENDRASAATRDRHLFTPGVRLYHVPAPGGWGFEVEADYQFGTVSTSTDPGATKQDVSAGFVHAEADYQLDGPWKPRIGAVFDFASGDRPGGKYGRFDTLYGSRRNDWGPTSLYGPLGRANIISPGIRIDVTPSKRWDGFIAWRAAWLDSPSDSFASTGIRDPDGRSGRFGANQIELRARYWIVPNRLRLDTGGAVLLRGRFLKDAPNAAGNGDTVYGYSDVTFTF